jgi:hypothetical protein
MSEKNTDIFVFDSDIYVNPARILRKKAASWQDLSKLWWWAHGAGFSSSKLQDGHLRITDQQRV